MVDPKVRLKREYLDQQAQSQKIGNKGLTGEEWYSQQASRAVNQAVGRVIRHQHDYGAIIFCDERFAHSNRKSQVSSWIQPHIKCYSNFGDIVYSLTRFFRDGRARGPTKQELTPNEDQEYKRDLQSSSPLLDKFHISQAGDSSCSLDRKSNKQEDIFSRMKEIVPANRSSLKQDRNFQDSFLKCSSNLNTGKGSWMVGKKCIRDSDGETDDLDAASVLKKPRVLITGPVQSKHEKFSNPFNSVVNQFSENVSSRNSQENRELQIDDETVTQKSTVKNFQEQMNVVRQTLTRNNEETKGSAFLNQVREKLSESEYKDFVGFMKALKSKAMKIGHALQSIARLFSPPDRLSLLYGFKEYIPAKYHSLYESYLPTNGNAVGV